MKVNKNIFSCLLFLLLSVFVKAQVESDTIRVITSFQPTISDAYKINDNPVIIDSAVKAPPLLVYSVFPKQVTTLFTVEPIKPAVMVGEPLNKLYRSLLKLGMGTYTTPYGEYFYNNLRSKDYSYGVHLNHLSSIATLKNSGFSGYSDNGVDVYGKKFINKHTLSGNLDYARNVVHFYGYNADTIPLKGHDITKQRFSYVSPMTRLTSHNSDSSKLNYDLKLRYYNLADSYLTFENSLMADATFKTYVEKQLLNVNVSADYYNNKTPNDTSNNTIVKINPSFLIKNDQWNITLGINAVENFSPSYNQFYFYPAVDFNYNIYDNKLIPYLGITGGLHRNTFKSLSDENPFVLSDLRLHNTDKKYNVYGGLRGILEEHTSYNLGMSYSKVNNMAMFVNTYFSYFDNNFTLIDVKNRFAVIYDDVNVLNVKGELAYQEREKLRLSLNADYNQYTTTKELKAWYMPEFKLTLSGNYNLRDKIVVRGDVFGIGKQYYRSTDITGKYIAKQLNGIIDVNLGLEYRYSKILSGFVNFNNIGSTRYYRWSQYPTQRFNLMAGVTYAF